MHPIGNFQAIWQAGRKPLKNALLFFGCLLAATYALGIGARLLLPLPDISELTQKIRYLEQNGGDIDTIAIGSSLVQHSFDAGHFDEAAAQAGCSFHSYNLGIGGMNLIEMRYVLRMLTAAHLPALKRVIIDPPNEIRLQYENLHSQRVWLTADPREAGTALAYILSYPRPRQYSSLMRYAAAFLYHNSAIGLIGRYFRESPPSEDPRVTDHAGYDPMDPARPADAQREHLLKEEPVFRAQLQSLKAEAAGEEPLAPIEEDKERERVNILQRLVDSIRAAGYRPMLLNIPDTFSEAIPDSRLIDEGLKDAGEKLAAFNMMAPAYAKTVYSFDNWYDEGHLNQSASRSLSAIAGRELCRQAGGK